MPDRHPDSALAHGLLGPLHHLVFGHVLAPWERANSCSIVNPLTARSKGGLLSEGTVW
jgi:hypothetical protein